MAAKTAFPPILDLATAEVLAYRQRRTQVELDSWIETKWWGLGELDATALRGALRRMVRWGWIEERATQGGQSRLAYRLTEAGRPFMAQADAFLEADRVEREQQWRRNQVVYGQDRTHPTAPLSEVQARAWLRGYFEHLVRTAPRPADLPFEALNLFDEVRERSADRMAPHNPYAKKG